VNALNFHGGKGQLSAILDGLKEIHISDIAVVSLAKKLEEVYVPGNSDPIRLPRSSGALQLLQQARDEAHRFAIAYHRTLRGKRMNASVISQIPGVGDKRMKLLLRHFGSVAQMIHASKETIANVPGIDDKTADMIYHWALNQRGQ
jgi:excinuclease ABC subunit C